MKSIEHMIRAMAGSLILISLILYLVHSNWWLLLTAFVGLNLLQSAFTGFCPAELVLKRIVKCATCNTPDSTKP